VIVRVEERKRRRRREVGLTMKITEAGGGGRLD